MATSRAKTSEWTGTLGRATRTLCRTGPRCRQHASRLDCNGGRSTIVRLQNGDDDDPNCDDSQRADCPRTCAKPRATGRQHHRRYYRRGLELIGKLIGLLGEAMPKLSTVRYLLSRPYWEDLRGAAAREAAKRAGISLKAAVLDSVFNEAEYQLVFRSMEQDRADALMVSDEAENLANRGTIVELVAKARIPAMYAYSEFVQSGGLMAYSIDLPDTFRRLANVVDKILEVLIREISRFTDRPNSS